MICNSKSTLTAFIVPVSIAALVCCLVGEAIADEHGTSEKTSKQDKKPIARLTGLVQDEADNPLAGARVRIAIPESDMRFVHAGSNHKTIEATTNKNGHYFIEVPGLEKPAKASVDAMKPGYSRLVGTLMRGRVRKSVELNPGKVTRTEAITLKPSLYYSGTVVDTAGEGIPDVEVSANFNTARASGGVERTATNKNGAFEIFNYSSDLKLANQDGRFSIQFFHPRFLRQQIADAREISGEQRSSLRVVLAKGNQIAGTLFETNGTPAAGKMVKAVSADGRNRKAVMTDNQGKFRLEGLATAQVELTSVDVMSNQKATLIINPNDDNSELKVRLQKLNLPKPKIYEILGMRMTDTTPKLKEAYDLFSDQGALILDPGKDSKRLNIGELKAGNNFWMVGRSRISNVKQFVEQLLEEEKFKNPKFPFIRVVYNFAELRYDGSNTQHMKLTADDLKELRELMKQLNQ